MPSADAPDAADAADATEPGSTEAGATESRPVDGHGALRAEIEDLLRRYTSESERLGQTFCEQHGLHRTDLHAIVHLHHASSTGQDVTAGALAEHLGLSSGATTALIDRLERVGHVQRVRAPSDRRRVTVRFARSARGVARAFFRPLGRRSSRVMEDFTEAELQVVARFLSAMTAAVTDYRRSAYDDPGAQRSPTSARPTDADSPSA